MPNLILLFLRHEGGIQLSVADVRTVPTTHDAHRLARQQPPLILAVRHHRLVVRILVNSRISLLATSMRTGGICGTGPSSVPGVSHPPVVSLQSIMPSGLLTPEEVVRGGVLDLEVAAPHWSGCPHSLHVSSA